MEKFNIVLEGLNCAGCAAKIEDDVRKIDGLDNVNFNFLKKKFIIEQSHYDKDELINKIQTIINKYENDVYAKYENEEYSSDKLQSCACDHDHDCNDDHHEHSHHNSEGVGFKIKVAKLIFAGLVLFAGMYIPIDETLKKIIFFVTYILVGKDVLISSAKNIAKGRLLDENFLMAFATIVAWIIGEYPEALGVMLFFEVGEMFQSMALDNSRKSIESLMQIRADYANLKNGDKITKVDPKDVKIGDIIIVKPGEKIPLDGVVTQGKSMIDTSMITGESVLRSVEENDEVLSGCINDNGLLTVKVNKSFENSTVSKILELVENASSKKAKTEQFITKFARWYTPIIVALAVLISIIPPLVLPNATFSHWIYTGCIFLVISCPCALVLSIPLGFFGGIGCASKNGILVKGSNYLEILNDLDVLVMDKTGTLTKGIFKVSSINAIGCTNEQLLEYASIAEYSSNHPIAKSILKEYKGEVDKENILEYEEISGFGVVVKYKDYEIFAGNKKLMQSKNINCKEPSEMGTVVHLAVDKDYKGYIIISDEIKEDAVEGIKRIKKSGVKKVIMLSGDKEEVANDVGKKLGIDEVYSQLLPQDKVEMFEKIKSSSSGNVGFVGDGMNDAPVLAIADVGFAMGGLGSDAAIESADVILMTDEVVKIDSSIKIANKTRQIVYQNITIALGVKVIVLVLSMFGMADMWEAVFADVGVALIAIFNSMRIIKYKF